MTTRPKKPVLNPVSANDKKIFDFAVKKWQEKLGLQGWRIERSTGKTKNMAEVSPDHKSRLATYKIGDSFGSMEVTEWSLEATALHELLHVLLFELVNQVDIELTGEALESAEHRVIHVLESLLLPAPVSQ